MQKERNSSVELLRIIATFMIVISHCCFHGFYKSNVGYTWISSDINRIILQLFNMGSLGVDIFIIIMGYYMVRRTSFFENGGGIT